MDIVKCGLDEDINKCKFYDKENRDCHNPNKCSYQEVNNISNPGYIRKERWYEKYYKRRK